MDISRPDDWQIYVSQEDVTNPFCINEPGTEEVIGQSFLSATFPERIQNVLCTFLTEGFEDQGAPIGGSGSMGVSFWNDVGSPNVQVRTKWAGTLDESWKETAQIPIPPPACARGDMCTVGDAVFNQENGGDVTAATTAAANCDNADLEECTFEECSAENCLNGDIKIDLTPLVHATCDAAIVAGFACPVCVPGKTCNVGMDVFNSVDGQTADMPAHCIVTDLNACIFLCSSDNCFNGALKTDLLAPVMAACATFDCLVVDSLGFESYAAAIKSNTEYGNSNFLGPGLAIQGKPWHYDYDGVPGNPGKGFQLGKSGNSPWGGTSAVDGVVYAIFQRESSIEQTLSGLVSGQRYTISWSQKGRPIRVEGNGNDINFSYDGVTIYFETNIVNTSWESKSAEFTASDEGILKIWTTNPLTGDRATFIDNIVLAQI
jgi:hypothetical protein